MKRLLLTVLGLATIATVAYAVQPTPTPILSGTAGTETGEESAGAASVVNVARLKLGSGVATAAGTAAAATATLNTASGIVTWPAPLTVVSNAQATLTLTDNKIQAGDIVIGMLDDTGAAAGAIAEVNAVRVSAGSAVFQITNASATSPAVAVKLMFFILTKGNPN